MGKRRTRPYYLSDDEYEREQEREKRMIDGITGAHSVAIVGDKRRRQPKASFKLRLNDTDSLRIVFWATKKDLNAEVIVAEIQRRSESSWESVGKIAVYRSPEGELSQLPNHPPL